MGVCDALLLLAVVVELFDAREAVQHGAIHLALGEAELLGTIDLFHGSAHSIFHTTLLGRHLDIESSRDLAGEQEGTVIHAGTAERAVGLLREFFQTLVQDIAGNSLDGFGHIHGSGVAEAVWDSLVLHADHDHLLSHLRILVAHDDGLGVVWHAVVLALGHGLLHGDGTEEISDLALYLLHIHVAHDDDAL